MSRESVKKDMIAASEELPEVVGESLEAYELVKGLPGSKDYPRDEIKEALRGQQGEIHFSVNTSETPGVPLIEGMENAEVRGSISRKGVEGTVLTGESKMALHMDGKGTRVSMTSDDGNVNIHMGNEQSIQFSEYDDGNVVSSDGIEATRKGYRAYSTERYNGDTEHMEVDVRFKRNGGIDVRTTETYEETFDDGSKSVSEERVKYRIKPDGRTSVTEKTNSDGIRYTEKEKVTLSPQQMEMFRRAQMNR